MKKLISIALAAALCTALTVPAAAITIGRWNFSGINEAIQNVAEDAPVQETKPVRLPAYLLEQVHKAHKVQRENAERYWNR